MRALCWAGLAPTAYGLYSELGRIIREREPVASQWVGAGSVCAVRGRGRGWGCIIA
jgi:hypothetical protein